MNEKLWNIAAASPCIKTVSGIFPLERAELILVRCDGLLLTFSEKLTVTLYSTKVQESSGLKSLKKVWQWCRQGQFGQFLHVRLCLSGANWHHAYYIHKQTTQVLSLLSLLSISYFYYKISLDFIQVIKKFWRKNSKNKKVLAGKFKE